jgi:hypothetical protein
VILRLCPEILEYRLCPEPLHQIPVLDLSMSNRIVDVVSLGVCDGLISNEIVQIVYTPLAGKMTRLVGYGRTTTSSSG